MSGAADVTPVHQVPLSGHGGHVKIMTDTMEMCRISPQIFLSYSEVEKNTPKPPTRNNNSGNEPHP